MILFFTIFCKYKYFCIHLNGKMMGCFFAVTQMAALEVSNITKAYVLMFKSHHMYKPNENFRMEILKAMKKM